MLDFEDLADWICEATGMSHVQPRVLEDLVRHNQSLGGVFPDRKLFGEGKYNSALFRAVIRGLFQLTPAEARVAQGLVEGRTVSEMAEQHGTGRETIRSQVKAVLHKTGSRRQAEAAAKLSGLGAIRIRQ